VIRFFVLGFIFGLPVSAADLALEARTYDLRLPQNSYIEEVPAIAVSPDGERTYVFNRGKRSLLVLDLAGKFLNQWDDVDHPCMLAFAGSGGVWMTDARADTLVKFSETGERLGSFDSPGKAVGKYGFLHGAVGKNGLFVSDILNWKVEHLTPLLVGP